MEGGPVIGARTNFSVEGRRGRAVCNRSPVRGQLDKRVNDDDNLAALHGGEPIYPIP
jgi:hypothetical protein